LTVGIFDVDILTVGIFDVGIFDVNILTVGIFDVDIFDVGHATQRRRPNVRTICLLMDACAFERRRGVDAAIAISK
jgi:hypothetical protein